MIEVEISPTSSGWDAIVEVTEGAAGSRHSVRVSHGDMDRWGRGGAPEDLVRRAFEFLLEREPADRILKSFDLADIESYFPDFATAMSR